MPIRLGHFEKPDKLTKSDDSNDTYAKYAAEPFETGFGHTIGNSLRRVLLSSLEGAAITSVKIEGADHEFTTVPGIIEDVTDIVLNLKKIKFRHTGREPQEVRLSVTAAGAVPGGARGGGCVGGSSPGGQPSRTSYRQGAHAGVHQQK